MALIVCPECGKQVSELAAVCPHCGFPLSAHPKEEMKTEMAKPAKKGKRYIGVGLLVLLALGITARNLYVWFLDPEAVREKAYSEASRHYYSGDYLGAMSHLEELGDYQDAEELMLSCKYNLGYEAMESRQWDKAVSYLMDLHYESSEKMLVDCFFMMALEESILGCMESTGNDRSLVSTELAYLDDFRNAEFYDVVLGVYASHYISGLDAQLESLNHERTSSAQLAWYSGMVTRFKVLDLLYREYRFMEDNKDFVGAYINQLEYHENWLYAMNAMEVNGHKQVKDPVGNQGYVEFYLKNDTPYTSNQTFDVTFWKDKDRKQLLGTSSATVENIGPYGQYTVHVRLPATVKQGTYYFSWTNYYDEIILN